MRSFNVVAQHVDEVVRTKSPSPSPFRHARVTTSTYWRSQHSSSSPGTAMPTCATGPPSGSAVNSPQLARMFDMPCGRALPTRVRTYAKKPSPGSPAGETHDQCLAVRRCGVPCRRVACADPSRVRRRRRLGSPRSSWCDPERGAERDRNVDALIDETQRLLGLESPGSVVSAWCDRLDVDVLVSVHADVDGRRPESAIVLECDHVPWKTFGFEDARQHATRGRRRQPDGRPQKSRYCDSFKVQQVQLSVTP